MMDIRLAINAVTLDDLNSQAIRVANVVLKVKEAILSPHSTKNPPKFSSSEIAKLCGVDKSQFPYKVLRDDLPKGEMKGYRREWSLADARILVSEYRKEYLRPKIYTTAAIITVANFKGGVAKTTSAVSLAQGLSLKGHRVLMIDLDPQGSTTSLFGFLPDSDVLREHTALGIFEGDQDMIDSAIRHTYWSGIDLVSAAPMLFSAEFALPSRQMKDPGFEFWRVLECGLDQARRDYDVIIIDTPPSLSYVTINALVAAEGVIIPIPPNALDFASSSQFWDLFSDLCNNLYRNSKQKKTFDFIDVLLSKAELNTASMIVRQWINESYGNKVIPIEIPKTIVAVNASAEFGTIYDVEKGSMNAKTYLQAKNAYDQFCDFIDGQIQAIWKRDFAIMEKFYETETKSS